MLYNTTNEHINSNKYKAILYLGLTGLLLSCLLSCAPTLIGTRYGYNTALHSSTSALSKKEESHSGASEFSVSIINDIGEGCTIVAEPTMTSTFLDRYLLFTTYKNTSTSLEHRHEYSMFKLPITLQYSTAIKDSLFCPYLGIGIQLKDFLSYQINSTGSILDSTLNPITTTFGVASPHVSSSFDFVLSSGVNVRLSDDWFLKLDARLQGASEVYTGSYDNYIKYDMFHLTTSLSLLLRL